MRHTSGHTGNRRSHHHLKVARFETCKNCGAKHLMHRVCSTCGQYRGRTVVDVTKKAVKAAKKAEGAKGTKAAPAKALATAKADKKTEKKDSKDAKAEKEGDTRKKK